jgi:hypothetical protein
MKLYISGPMSNLPEHNFPAFRAAAEKLTRAGYDVIDPSENFGGDTTLDRSDYMREDIGNVLKADGLALLPGWSQSKGASLEVQIADELGLETLIVETWVRGATKGLLPIATIPGRVLNKGGTFASDEDYGYVNPAAGTLASYASTKASRESTAVLTHENLKAARASMKAHVCDETFCKEHPRETILEEAQRLVHGDRGAAYGHPADDFGRTAEYWTTTFKKKLKPGERFHAGDIPLALIGVKLSREVNKPKRDNMTDLAGYAETRRMVLERDGAS